ncbi:MAG TPA: hypothetical protein VNM67_05075 [Thermoanaerobaculia bacterium]|jgi:hypothetical protein|nr:hypothetical protein [Thermoanaerobaculia bacterium]
MRQGLYLFSRLLPAALGLLPFLAVSPAAAWTPRTQSAIAREAAQLAPPDLARQIEKHKEAFEAGVQAPFQDADPDRHRKDPDGSGSLDQALFAEVDAAISAIRLHKPFEEVVRRLGAAAHYAADANNPLAVSGADPEEARYFLDYLRYAETAEPRFPLVFYGVPPSLDRQRNLKPLLAEAFRRGREVYPMVGREYRKIGFASGIRRFDDRSTAFGVASVAFSHAVTDVTLVLRYIWIAAGGADNRSSMMSSGSRLLLLPRADRGH